MTPTTSIDRLLTLPPWGDLGEEDPEWSMSRQSRWRAIPGAIRRRLVERLPAVALAPIRSARGRWLRLRLRRGYVNNRSGVRLFVRPEDPRALWLARNHGVTDP